jgi:hypothetical protein
MRTTLLRSPGTPSLQSRVPTFFPLTDYHLGEASGSGRNSSTGRGRCSACGHEGDNDNVEGTDGPQDAVSVFMTFAKELAHLHSVERLHHYDLVHEWFGC